MNVDGPSSDATGEGERQEAMDEEDESRSQGSMMDGNFNLHALFLLWFTGG
jgi:hypothetical protein